MEEGTCENIATCTQSLMGQHLVTVLGLCFLVMYTIKNTLRIRWERGEKQSAIGLYKFLASNCLLRCFCDGTKFVPLVMQDDTLRKDFVRWSKDVDGPRELVMKVVKSYKQISVQSARSILRCLTKNYGMERVLELIPKTKFPPEVYEALVAEVNFPDPIHTLLLIRYIERISTEMTSDPCSILESYADTEDADVARAVIESALRLGLVDVILPLVQIETKYYYLLDAAVESQNEVVAIDAVQNGGRYLGKIDRKNVSFLSRVVGEADQKRIVEFLLKERQDEEDHQRTQRNVMFVVALLSCCRRHH